MPKPFGIKGLSFDKLEIDKAGIPKLECCVDQALHNFPDFKMLFKTDLKGWESLNIGVSYTGFSSLFAKAEFTAGSNDYAAEATYSSGDMRVGAKNAVAKGRG